MRIIVPEKSFTHPITGASFSLPDRIIIDSIVINIKQTGCV